MKIKKMLSDEELQDLQDRLRLVARLFAVEYVDRLLQHYLDMGHAIPGALRKTEEWGNTLMAKAQVPLMFEIRVNEFVEIDDYQPKTAEQQLRALLGHEARCMDLRIIAKLKPDYEHFDTLGGAQFEF